MEHRDVFIRVACPSCGRVQDAMDMKSNGGSGDGFWEHYHCPCGTRFTVSVTSEAGPGILGRFRRAPSCDS